MSKYLILSFWEPNAFQFNFVLKFIFLSFKALGKFPVKDVKLKELRCFSQYLLFCLMQTIYC